MISLSKYLSEGHALIRRHIAGGIDTLGEEIDLIEKELKEKYPQIKHVDLEQM